MKIRLLHLLEGLLIDGLIIIAGTTPFLDEWANRLKHKLQIFGISLSCRCARLKLHGMSLCLHLLASIPIEELWQMINQPCTFLCEEVACPVKSTLEHLAESCQRRTTARCHDIALCDPNNA